MSKALEEGYELRLDFEKRRTAPDCPMRWPLRQILQMSRYGIPDIRLLYDSDVRFLEQFA